MIITIYNFLLLVELRKAKKRALWQIVKRKKFVNNSLLNKLLELQEPQGITTTINEYWTKYWKKTEETRYSQKSQIAYASLKRILKYHLFEKRDGGIIHSLKEEDGTVVSDPEIVNSMLLKTMEELQVDNKWGWLEEKPFPKLPRLSEEEMVRIVDRLASEKAIAYDGLSGILFSKEKRTNNEKSNMEKIASKLRNIWRLPLHQIQEIEDSWDTRLVPLNKVFPEIGTRKQLRPIAIQSQIVKLLEARFLPKLQEYLNNKLDRAQTGFIQRMGIQVNLTRALERISLRTKRNRVVYGLFIDFSNAYNSIPHTLLFQKLRIKKVLEEDEIAFIEQLYARYKLRIGNESLKSNKGVAQGSLISPALFNIYIEDLSEELKEKVGINLEDLLYYADDLLALCSSIEQVRKAIQVITEWSEKNGMLLNKSKSGLVIFAGRKVKDVPRMKTAVVIEKKTRASEKTQVSSKRVKRKLIPAQKDIEGVPICEKYKYLGTILTPKLTSGEQINYIRRKSTHLLVKLYPYLKNASCDARRDMWQTMVRPLFNAALCLLYYEPSKVQKQNLLRLWRTTFKEFMMISKRTATALVDEMIGVNLEEIAANTVEGCRVQWNQRKENQEVEPKPKGEKNPNLLRGVPNSWSKLIKTQLTPCPKCKIKGIICSSWHMMHTHGIYIKPIYEIWTEQICSVTKDSNDQPRSRLAEEIDKVISQHLLDFEAAKNSLMHLSN